MAFSYYQLYRMKTQPYFLRQQLVDYAKEHGLKAAAKHFSCSCNTVRKWLQRKHFQELSKKPHHCPHQTAKDKEALILEFCKQSGFGAQRLKMEFDVPCSVRGYQKNFTPASLEPTTS